MEKKIIFSLIGLGVVKQNMILKSCFLNIAIMILKSNNLYISIVFKIFIKKSNKNMEKKIL